LRTREDIPAEIEPIPLGSARVPREGKDVTVVAIGQTVPVALRVADQLGSDISVEVFDPRTIYPFDWAALAESVGKTGRLVVADDSNMFCGLAAEVLATAAEQLPLLAPPRRVTRPDGTVVPFAAALDLAVQPDETKLTAAIRAVVKHDGWASLPRLSEEPCAR
jgi:pyruvate dehydrogenase E1 component beta subunit